MSQFKKTVVITGGCGFIGRKIIGELLKLDYYCVIIDINKLEDVINEFEEIINNQYNCKNINNYDTFYNFIECDLSDRTQLDDTIKILQNYETIDVLINCAGYVGTSNLSGWCVPFEEQSLETFEKCLFVNLIVPFYLANKLINKLKNSDNASIINIGSIYGTVAPRESLYKNTDIGITPCAYSVSKGGLHQLTKYLASVLGKYNIRVNTVSPGGVFRNQDVRFVNNYTNNVPLNRMCTENDIIGTIKYLISYESSYVTGQNIHIDGGLTCL